jgi:hypothetical protein
MMMKLLGFLTPQFGGGNSGGGGGAPSNQNITTSNIAPWAQKGVESLIHSGMQNVYPNMKQNEDGSYDLGAQAGYTPFNANTTTGASGQALESAKSTTAGFTPLQEQAFQGAQDLQMPSQYGMANNFANMSGRGALGTTVQGGIYGNLGAQQGLGFGQQAQDPNAVQRYMNPYLQDSLNPQLAEIQRQYDITGQGQQSNATKSGAFGGSREALMAAENQRNKNMAMNQVIGQGYNQAFQNAQQQMAQAAQMGMQGAGIGLQGVAAQQAGYGQAGQAGTNLANIGGQQLQAQQGILNTQAQFGGQQQANKQAMLDRASQIYAQQQNYPMMQLGQLESLYTGAPQNVNQLGYQAPPSMTSQLAGMGTAGLGAYGLYNAANRGFKKGGVVKYSSGGIVSLGLNKAMRSKA